METSKLSTKQYKCAYCGREKMIQTNHYGECYGQLGMNECPACSNERPGTPTVARPSW